MISVKEALELLSGNLERSEIIETDIENVLGDYLGEDIHSPIDMPPFDQSAMDGYALNFSEDISSYEVVGEIAAGSADAFELESGQAVRIFTGASVPKSANTVVKQEIVERGDDTIQMTEAISVNQNIRPRGEQIRSGELAMKKGSLINPPSIGFLTGLGLKQVKAYRKPALDILATGDELVPPGQKLADGQIYESNSYMLSAALDEYGYVDHGIKSIPDNYEETLAQIKESLEHVEVLLLSGGISVGDYDYVGKALNELGVERIFYKVKQKPGKPIFFGKYNGKYIFALPGNPAAAMTSFYTYVLPALNFISGGEFRGLKVAKASVINSFESKSDRAVFLKAKVLGDEVQILDGQSSAMLKSFAEANALIYMHEDEDTIEEGDTVNVMLL